MTGITNIVQADVTTLSVDAIVNPTDESLLGGGSVSGAIRQAAGPGLIEECQELGGCQPGDAKLTKGHGLPAKYVIHMAFREWQDGNTGSGILFESGYRRAMTIAAARDIRTVAFPSLSSDTNGYSGKLAAYIAVATVKACMVDLPGIREVTFCCPSPGDMTLYQQVLDALSN